MPVAKQVYTLPPTWTAAQLADTFRSAFIDAGLMTEWHDSFVNGGIENRVLRVVYDNTKSYGTTFYWFMFTTGGAFVDVAAAWNTTTKQPSGTALLDFSSNTTNSVNNHYRIFTATASLTLELFRYTSAVNAGFSWFFIRNGSTSANFSILSAGTQVAPWIDLNKTLFHHFVRVIPFVSGWAAGLTFTIHNAIRRSFVLGTALNTYTGNFGLGGPFSFAVSAYSIMGRGALGNNDPGNNFGGNSGANRVNIATMASIVLPIGSNSANPAYTADYNPVFTGLPVSHYAVTPTIPSDFGIVPHYITNTMNPIDKFIVTAGVEEWEIIAVANNTIAGGGVANIAFAARIV